MREKEKMLVTSIFSLSHSIKEKNCHFINILSIVWQFFQFGHIQNFDFWKKVKHYLAVTMKFVFGRIGNIADKGGDGSY